MNRFVISFYTTSDAMHTEYACKREGLDGKLIPVPRELSAGCGIAWACEESASDATLSLLEREGVEWEDSRVVDIP